MTKGQANKKLREGYYGDVLETDEVIGILVTYFPEVYSEDLELEEMVAEACYGQTS